MTDVGDDTRGRFPGRWWLAVGCAFVVVATVVLVSSADARWLRLGIIAALWAALTGAVIAARYHGQATSAVDSATQAQAIYELELEREIAARREYELEVEAEARTRVTADSAEELAALRAELAALRQGLQSLLGGEVLYERVALTAQAARMQALRDQRVVQAAGGVVTGRPQLTPGISLIANSPTELITRITDSILPNAQAPTPGENPAPYRAPRRVEPSKRPSHSATEAAASAMSQVRRVTTQVVKTDSVRAQHQDYQAGTESPPQRDSIPPRQSIPPPAEPREVAWASPPPDMMSAIELFTSPRDPAVVQSAEVDARDLVEPDDSRLPQRDVHVGKSRTNPPEAVLPEERRRSPRLRRSEERVDVTATPFEEGRAAASHSKPDREPRPARHGAPPDLLGDSAQPAAAGHRYRPEGELPTWQTGSHRETSSPNGRSARRREAGQPRAGSRPRTEDETFQPSNGSHSNGRSVHDLLAAHGMAQTHRRHRRQAEE